MCDGVCAGCMGLVLGYIIFRHQKTLSSVQSTLIAASLPPSTCACADSIDCRYWEAACLMLVQFDTEVSVLWNRSKYHPLVLGAHNTSTRCGFWKAVRSAVFTMTPVLVDTMRIFCIGVSTVDADELLLENSLGISAFCGGSTPARWHFASCIEPLWETDPAVSAGSTSSHKHTSETGERVDAPFSLLPFLERRKEGWTGSSTNVY